jgi:hypothetical protein
MSDVVTSIITRGDLRLPAEAVLVRGNIPALMANRPA